MSLSSEVETDHYGSAEAGFRSGFRTADGESWSSVVTEGEEAFAPLATPELRTGNWTRLGDGALLGDPVSEGILGEIADAARAAAEAQGYAVGWAQGMRAAEAEAAQTAALLEEQRRAAEARREAEHREAVAGLQAAAEGLREQLAALAERIETQATELAWAITESLIGREVESVTGTDVVRRVISVLPPTTCTVRLHPDVLSSAAVGDLYDRGVEVVPDPRLGLADAMVASDGGVIDLRIAQATERVREALK